MIPAVFPLKEPSSSARSLWFIYLGYSALLCGIFAWMGFPKPHVDDPWYVGTAEHLAKTGDLYNPYIRNWMSIFTPGRYFTQFPLYPFVLAGWMKLAGISTHSVLVFFFLTNFLCCGFAGWFVRRARLPVFLYVFLPWMILSLGQTQGLRGDIPGLCAFWISLTCLTYPKPIASFFAALSGCASVLLWPAMLGFLVPLFIGYLAANGSRIPQARRLRWCFYQLFCLSIGLGLAILAFLLMIGFEWSSFYHDFFAVAAMRRPAGNSVLFAFFGLSWARYDHGFLLSIFLLSLFAAYWVLRRSPKLSFPTRLWILETLFGSFFSTVLYAVNTQLIYFFFWMAFWAVTAEFIRTKAKLELVVIAVLSFGLWRQSYYSAKNFIPFSRPDTATILAELKTHSDKTVVFDELAYRSIFDLQPPSGALAWLCLRQAPDLGATMEDKKPNQIWLISESRVTKTGLYSKIVLVK